MIDASTEKKMSAISDELSDFQNLYAASDEITNLYEKVCATKRTKFIMWLAAKLNINVCVDEGIPLINYRGKYIDIVDGKEKLKYLYNVDGKES